MSSTPVSAETRALEQINEAEDRDGAPPRDLNAVQEAIFQRGILVDLDFRQWTGKIALKPADIGLAEIPDGIRLGTIQLFDKELVGKPPSIHSVTRRSVDAITYQFPLSRGRYIPYTRYEALDLLLRTQKERFVERVNELLTNYEGKREAAIAEWIGKMRTYADQNGVEVNFTKFEERIRNRFPTEAQVRRKFVFDWTYFRIDAPRDIKVAAFNEEARRRLDTSMRQWVEETMLVLRGEIARIANKLRELLAAKGTNAPAGIPPKSKASILKQIEVVATLNCFDDAESAGMIQRLKDEVENDFADDDALSALITEVTTFAEEDIDGAMVAVMDNMIGAGDRIVEV